MAIAANIYYVISNADRTLFGIRAVSGEETPLIFSDCRTPERLVQLFQREALDPIHLNDVVRDLILEPFCHCSNES